MPIYTYRCNDCDHEFEKRQRMSDDPLTDCPVCVGHVRRVVNSVGIVFKGSGFYVTDNRNGSNLNGSGNSATQKDDQKSEASSEKKSAPKAEKKAETTS